MKLPDKQTNELLEMYLPQARYLSQVSIEEDNLHAKLKFPEVPAYLTPGTGITHINNSEVEMIVNQGLFLFVRNSLLNGSNGFPVVEEKKINKYYDGMFIKKMDQYYYQFVNRSNQDLVLKLNYQGTRETPKAYSGKWKMEIPGFFSGEVIAGLVKPK